LDKPLWQQYTTWLGGVVQLDFGRSFKHPDETVVGLIRRTWPVTIHLGGMALILAFSIGVPLGVISALKQNSLVDYIATLISILGFVTPHFVLGILFILVFALALKLVPTGAGIRPSSGSCPQSPIRWRPWRQSLATTRASVVDIIRSDYVRTARAKGLAERTVVSRHVMKNALIPMITVFGPLIPDLITALSLSNRSFACPAWAITG